MADQIVRSWEATADRGGAAAYERHFADHVLPSLLKVSGYLGATLLRRDEADGRVRLLVLTTWESMESIRAFAGQDVEAAVVADEAAKVLASYDNRVKHYRAVITDAV